MVLDIHTHPRPWRAVVPATIFFVTPVVISSLLLAWLFTFRVVPGVVLVKAAVAPVFIIDLRTAVSNALIAPVVFLF